MTDTTIEREAEPESLAPAVTRAALILDVLAETAGDPVGPSELARRLGLPEVVDRQHLRRPRRRGTGPADRDGVRARPAARGAGRRLPRLRRPGPGVLRPDPATARGLGGDRPVRRARRPRGHVPRPPRWSPASPADVANRPPAARLLDGDRQGGAGVVVRRRAGSPARRPRRAAPALCQVACERRRRCAPISRGPYSRLRGGRRGDDGGRRLLRDDDPGAAARRGAVRREHHAAQGPRDARARAGPPGRPAAASRRCRTRSAGRQPGDALSRPPARRPRSRSRPSPRPVRRS